MRINALELSAVELIRLLLLDANADRARPVSVAAQKEYIIEEEFDGSAYGLENDIGFDLVTSTATLTVEPQVESGYWILEITIEYKPGPVAISQAKKLGRKALTLDEFEGELYAQRQKRVNTQLYVQTPGVTADFYLWLAKMRERHPEVAGSLPDEYQNQNFPEASLLIPKSNADDSLGSELPPFAAQHRRSGLRPTPEREKQETEPHPAKITPQPTASPKPSASQQLSTAPQMRNVHDRRAKARSGTSLDKQHAEPRISETPRPVASRYGFPSSQNNDTGGQHNSAVGAAITFVEQVLSKARDRLVTIRSDSPLTAAAERLYEPTCAMVVVCDAEGIMVGVITRTDIIRRIRHCQGVACVTQCGMVMSKQVIFCHAHDRLDETWSVMKEIGLHSLPVIDTRRRPIGLLSARDALETLLESVEYEEGLLRDYIMCVGYR